MNNPKPFLLIVFLWIYCLPAKGQNNSILYSFFVAGHTYGAPGVDNEGFHPPFKDKYDYIQNRPEIELGVLVGDIVSSNPTAQDWDEIDAEIDTLNLPIHFAVGNHDMEDRPLFEARYGLTYYSFVHKNDLFIILDPNIDGWSITGAQLQFLENTISNNYQITENVFVFFHQILWKENTNAFNYIHWNSSEGRIDPVNFWSTIVPMFEAIPNNVYMFAGDLGASWSSNVTYDRYNNLTLMATGMGHEDGENFIVVNVDTGKAVSYDLICLSDPDPNCLGELTDHLTVDSTTTNIFNASDASGPFGCLIYPNPANDQFTVSSNLDFTFELFDVSGALVLSFQNSGLNSRSISTSHLQKGIYLARSSSIKGVSIQKIVIE